MIEDRKIFITGGAGFIGTKLCSQLYQHNQILLYDNLHRNSIKFTNLLNEDNINLIEGDVLDFGHLNKAVAEFSPDIVIHLAAIAGIEVNRLRVDYRNQALGQDIVALGNLDE